MSKLGLIAGGGGLPLALAEQCRAAGRPLFVIRLKGFADEALYAYDGGEVGLGEVGKCFALLHGAGCEAVCLAGKVSRPDFSALKPDLRGVAALGGAILAARKGEDAILRYMVELFEKEGFAVEGAHEVAAGLTLPAGPLTRRAPPAEALEDIRHGFHVAGEIGRLDIGQGAVACRGLILAVEAQEGTDAMLARCAQLPETLRGTAESRAGVLVKRAKPTQEQRVDLPTIGVTTIEGAAWAGLAGVVGEAGRTLLLDRAAVIEAADRLGLFVFGHAGD
ncbi:MAG TPA: UDP-2,3-diacylglucosamine diphosphatase LpxI [Caulobacteraceae bacterium]|nr:UDP-2,3-diacylglucosamine diphosphatase LpxI [Caulobacteraceae bacterium]